MVKVKKEKKTEENVVTKDQDIDTVIDMVNKRFGKGLIQILGNTKIEPTKVISTGSILTDEALIIGGLPRGRIVELFGPEGSGKTTLSLHVVANAQKSGGNAAFIDAEHSLSIDLAQNVGVNVPALILSQPDYGEQALEILEMLIKSGKFDVIVIDSVAALVPKAEIDGSMEDAHMGLQARMMGTAMRKLAGIIATTNTCVIFVNQLRQTIGGYGPSTITPGGKALKYNSSIRMEVSRIGAVKQGEVVIGNRVKINVVKNKLAPPFRSCETDLIFGKGFNKEGEVLDKAVELDIVDRNGSWYSYKEDKIGQGRPEACKFLKERPELYEELLKIVKETKNENLKEVRDNPVEEVSQ